MMRGGGDSLPHADVAPLDRVTPRELDAHDDDDLTQLGDAGLEQRPRGTVDAARTARHLERRT